MVNSPLIRPYFLRGGWHWGGPLGSHDMYNFRFRIIPYDSRHPAVFKIFLGEFFSEHKNKLCDIFAMKSDCWLRAQTSPEKTKKQQPNQPRFFFHFSNGYGMGSLCHPGCQSPCSRWYHLDPEQQPSRMPMLLAGEACEGMVWLKMNGTLWTLYK